MHLQGIRRNKFEILEMPYNEASFTVSKTSDCETTKAITKIGYSIGSAVLDLIGVLRQHITRSIIELV